MSAEPSALPASSINRRVIILPAPPPPVPLPGSYPPAYTPGVRQRIAARLADSVKRRPLAHLRLLGMHSEIEVIACDDPRAVAGQAPPHVAEPEPLPLPAREDAVLAAYREMASLRAVAERFGISPSTVRVWLMRATKRETRRKSLAARRRRAWERLAGGDAIT